MPLTLHAAFVPSALQMLGAMHHLVDTAEGWAGENAMGEADIISARLHPEMLPFAYQVKSVAEHTAGALRGIDAGVFSPSLTAPPKDFAGLREHVSRAEIELGERDPAALERAIGQPMRFEMGELVLPFTAEEFLLSFSQPNFYFHAATAYDILRHLGVPIGKRDFMGKLRITRGAG